jgi:hypothetical protein
MPIGAALVRFGQFLHNLLNGVEAMYNEIIVQRAPADVFPTLYADVDEDKRFGKKPRAHHPLGEFGIVVDRKIHIHIWPVFLRYRLSVFRQCGLNGRVAARRKLISTAGSGFNRCRSRVICSAITGIEFGCDAFL